MYRSHVLVCGGTGCTSSNSAAIIEALESEIKKHGLENEVKVVRTGCFGLCARGPIMVVYPEGSYYSLVKPEDVPEIVEEHLLKGRIVKRLLFEEFTMDDIKSLKETDFYKKQHLVAGTYKKWANENGVKYFSVASGGGTGRTLHPDNVAAGPASYGLTDSMGRMHGDAQFAGSSSVPAHVEMMGLIGMGNNPMVGATVACAVAVEEAAK